MREKETVHVGTFGCGEENCKSLLPLFAIWSVSTTEQERRDEIGIWQWENLLCPQEHAIEKPSN
jgi:hypothetical protein